MSFKVIRRTSDNAVLAFGPNTDQYDPAIPAGAAMTIDPAEPTLPLPTQDELAAEADQRMQSPDRMTRLLIELNFDQENRLRVLQGQATITRAQYRAALSNIYKALP